MALGSPGRVSTSGATVGAVTYLGRSCRDSMVIKYKIFQFSRIELVLVSVNLHLFSFLGLPVCVWFLAWAGDGRKQVVQAGMGHCLSGL